jgi:hypothetical protein
MHDCTADPTYDEIKDNNGEPNGCGHESAYIFFVSYMLIIAFVFINLFIAVILEGFEQSEMIENSMMNTEHMNIFKKAWVKLDPLGSGFITTLELRPLLGSMPPPLGFLDAPG